jgi:pyruvate kinase
VPHAHTKIVATIGPASRSEAIIDALLAAGMNVARLNCAHADHETLRRSIAMLRAAAGARDVPLAILADLGGPKLRVGRIEGGAALLVEGSTFVLTTDDVLGTDQRVSVNHPELPRDVRAGDAVYLNDGLIRLVVTAVGTTEVTTRVELGGWLNDRKGLSVPDSETSLPSLTEKDWRDVDFLAQAGIDYVGLSFVRSAEDIEILRRGLADRGAPVAIVAKIEKAQAVERLPAIVAAADAVMVARGDLGVECPIEEVPILQKRIIRACRNAGVPVITATQMLESMVLAPRPTRAEATDVAAAVIDGTDAVMLSAETATGQHPVAAVSVMARITARAERHVFGCAPCDPELAVREQLDPADAIARSARLAADSVQAAAIVCLTQSGATARYLAKWRPRQSILAVTPHRETRNRLALVWGVEASLSEKFAADFDRACARVVAQLREEGKLEPGSRILATAGLPFADRVATNTLRIMTV